MAVVFPAGMSSDSPLMMRFDFSDPYQAELRVLRVLHEGNELADRPLHLSDDVLYGKHHTQRDASM